VLVVEACPILRAGTPQSFRAKQLTFTSHARETLLVICPPRNASSKLVMRARKPGCRRTLHGPQALAVSGRQG